MHPNTRALCLFTGLLIVLALAGLRFSPASAVQPGGDSVTISLSAPVFASDPAGGLRLLPDPAQAAVQAAEGKDAPAWLTSNRAPVYSTDVNEGEPVLPHRLVTLILPPDADMESLALEIDGVQVEQAPGAYTVPLALPKVLGCAPSAAVSGACAAPAQPGAAATQVISTLVLRPQTVSATGQTALQDEQPVTLMPFGQMRKWKLAKLDYHPFRYDPATGNLTVTRQVTARVTFRRDPALLDRTLLSDTALDDMAPQAADNYAEARPWYDTALAGLGGPLTAMGANDYVVVAPDALLNNNNTILGQYMTFLRDHGHGVSGIPTSNYGGKTGEALADAIRADLQLRYPSWGIRYVLLVGDPNPDGSGVPMRNMYPDWLVWTPTPTEPNRIVPTDLYYADLTGDWDNNKDGKPGEAANLVNNWAGDFGSGGVDFHPEVYVGRIPVYNNDYAALNAILQKLMDYQNVPGRPAWRDTALLAGAFWGVDYDGAVLSALINRDALKPNAISAYRIYSDYPNPNTANCQYEQYSAYQHEASLGNQVLQNRWASNPPGLMVWAGHGNVGVTATGFGYAYKDWQGNTKVIDCWRSDLFNTGQIPALNDAMPAFTYHNSCLNGYPESSGNMGYSLLRHGAVSTVSASRITWLDKSGETVENLPTTYTSAAGKGYNYVLGLMQGQTAGEALHNASALFPIHLDTDGQNNFDFNLYGDPAMTYYVGPFTGVLGIPSGLFGELIKVDDTSSFHLTWTDQSNFETYFRITLSPTDASGDTVIDVDRNRVTTTVSTPACGKTYNITVRSGNGSNLSSPSNTIALASEVCPPDKPAHLYATIVNGKIHLDWDNVGGEEGYRILRRVKMGTLYGYPVLIGSTGADVTTFTDTTAVCVKTYVYTVSAYNATGSSLSSPAVTVNSPMCPPPAPSNLAAVPAQASISLSWTDNSNGADNGEAGFEIWQMLPGGSWNMIWKVLPNTTSYVVTGLQCSGPSTQNSSYKVAAYNNGGRAESGVINTKPAACTTPAAPTNLTVEEVTTYPDSVMLTWDDMSDNEWGFKIEKQNGASWDLVATLGPDENSKQITNITCSASYVFHIYAYNGAGPSALPYASVNASTDACDTNVPSDFQGSGGADGITLTWDLALRQSIPTYFEIQRGVPALRLISWTTIATPPGGDRTYTDTDVACGHSYYYHIRAIKTGDLGGYTSAYTPAILINTAICPPPAPSSVHTWSDSASSIEVLWRPPLLRAVLDGYNVYRWSGGTLGLWVKIGSTLAGDLSFTDSHLLCGRSYDYRVKAYNDGGESAFSDTATGTTQECPPAAPSDLQRSNQSGTALVLAWTDASSNEDGFILQRYDAVEGWLDDVTTGAGVAIATSDGLACGTLYQFRVVSFNAGGESAPSPVLNTATSMCKPTLFVEAGVQGLVTITWQDASTFPTPRYFKRLDSPGGTYNVIGSASPGETSFRDLTAPCGQPLSYIGWAANEISSGYESDPVALTTICAPTTVMTLSIGTTTMHTIALHWTATGGGHTGFILERSADGTNNWRAIANLSARETAFSDTGLPPGMPFYYRLRAFNTGGEVYSPVVAGQTVGYLLQMPLVLK